MFVPWYRQVSNTNDNKQNMDVNVMRLMEKVDSWLTFGLLWVNDWTILQLELRLRELTER